MLPDTNAAGASSVAPLTDRLTRGVPPTAIDPQVQRHILFRDYLRAHPEAAQEYSRLKEELARCFPNDRGAYTEGKTEFIQGIDEKAKLWATGRTCQN